MHTYFHTHIHTYIYIYVHAYTHTHIYIYVYVYVCIYIYIYEYICVCIYCLYIYMHITCACKSQSTCFVIVLSGTCSVPGYLNSQSLKACAPFQLFTPQVMSAEAARAAASSRGSPSNVAYLRISGRASDSGQQSLKGIISVFHSIVAMSILGSYSGVRAMSLSETLAWASCAGKSFSYSSCLSI